MIKVYVEADTDVPVKEGFASVQLIGEVATIPEADALVEAEDVRYQSSGEELSGEVIQIDMNTVTLYFGDGQYFGVEIA